MPGVAPHGMDLHHSYGGMNGHGGGYSYGPRNGYGGPEIDQHSIDRYDQRDMEPTVELDHLATYSSKSGVMKPEDGLRKLRGMESTTGIWTMRCMMVIERGNLIIIDKGTGEELERFPMELVHEPTAIFKEDKREVYTNLILFTILENHGKHNSRCDMHIFQSINAPAQDIVDEILAAKEGRPKSFSSKIPPPPMGPAPEPPGGRWIVGSKEPKSHFSYSTDAQENQEPKFGKRETFRNPPDERHTVIERQLPVNKEPYRRMPTPVEESFTREKLPLGQKIMNPPEERHTLIERQIPVKSGVYKRMPTPVEENFTREKFIPLGQKTREKMSTPPPEKFITPSKYTPFEERRQRNSLSSIPAVDETLYARTIPIDSMQQERGMPSVEQKLRNPHVKEHFVERRYAPTFQERRSSIGNSSFGNTSEGFSTADIQEEEFDIPERYLSHTGRRSSGSDSRVRSSSVDRYTLPGSHGNSSMMSDGYAVPQDHRNSEKYNFSSRERRASTGGYEIPVYTEPRRLSISSASVYEVPLKLDRDPRFKSEHDLLSTMNREHRNVLYGSDYDLQSSMRGGRGHQYRSEHDLQSAMRPGRNFIPENGLSSSSSNRGRWKFGDRRQQYSSSNQGSSSGYSSMEPSVQYSTMPNPKSKSKQSSRYHFKTTTLRDEGIKSNDGFRPHGDGFRVIPNEGFRSPSGVQNEGFFRSQENAKDLYSLPIRDKESFSRGYYGQTQQPRASYHEPSSGSNETLERDVQFLNCCFDDIEKFVARLQQAAEAYKELENRKRERQSHKKKNDRGPPPRDGMLSMRARPPPADDFIDIFQKIKWAFNLLAKLKAHIHDPNAPELVHFIFTPLSLIYEASRDPVHAGVDLASKAVSPLLTRDAKELLLNCLTSKELELWQLLGRNWTTSEDEYPGHVEVFYPRFYNGWTPAPPSQQMVGRQLPTPREEPPRDDYGGYGRTRQEEPAYGRSRREEEPAYGRSRREEEPRPNYVGSSFRPDMDDEPYRREPMYEKKRPSTPPPGAVANPNVARYQEYVEKHIDRNQEAQRYPTSRAQENLEYKEDLRRKNAKTYEAVHERTGRNPKEITVEKGDILEVLDDSRNWWRLRNCKGETGYAPYTILRDVGDDRNDVDRNLGDQFMDAMYLNGGRRGSIGGYSGNIGHNQSNHIPAAPPPPRKDEEVFEREIKPSHHPKKESDRRSIGSDRYRQGSRQQQDPSSGDRYRNRTDSSDGDNFSGSYDGSIEDTVERRSNRSNDRRPTQKPSPRNRNSYEHKHSDDSRGYHNRSFEEDPPPTRHRAKSPPPPPRFVPPPPPHENRPSSGRKYVPPGQGGERRTERDELHNELTQRLSGKPSLKSKPQHKDVYLSTHSSPYEVKEWLRSKTFSERCVNALSGYNGYDLLRLKTKEIEKLIGHDEAQRLTGHLTLQKNITGYKTQGPRELQAILQQRKQRADVHRDDDVGQPPSFAPESPDYSDDNSEASSEDFGNAGKTLRALLQHQRKKITNYKYEQ